MFQVNRRRTALKNCNQDSDLRRIWLIIKAIAWSQRADTGKQKMSTEEIAIEMLDVLAPLTL